MPSLARINRRGACPALAAPMQTGDGLLARLNPVQEGLTPKQLIGLCKAAARHGNAIVEVTARGSLQMRGLTRSSAVALASDIDDLAIQVRTGTTVATGPLAGLDPEEIADPRPLAQAIRDGIARRGLNGKLAPKVSVVVDGGGLWRLESLQADIRCSAEFHAGGPLWHLTIGSEGSEGRSLGTFAEADTEEAALRVLEELAQRGPAARARDLNAGMAEARSSPSAPVPLGRLVLAGGRQAVALALPFGSVDAAVLADFVRSAERLGADEFRPAAPRALIVLTDASGSAELIEHACGSGFITDANDPAMRIFACPGAPACSFGHFDTREAARAIADTAPALFKDASVSLHVSGCAKGCAHPSPATLTLVGDEKSVGIVVGGTARSLPLAHTRPKALADTMGRLAGQLNRCRNTAKALSRLGANELSSLFRQGME